MPGIRASATGTLHALASRDLDMARSWAAEFDVPRAYGSYQEVLDDPEVNAIYIPLPNELHQSWVLAAADAGKPILCEKPLALDARQAQAMAEYCARRGVLLMEAFMWRHQPRSLELRKLVRRGEIGELRLIRSSFSFPITPGDWRLDASRGGGALWDVGCYGVSTARFFAGSEPTRTQAAAHFGETGVDLTLTALLEFPGDVIGVIDCSFEQPFRCVYELVGTRAAIKVESAYLPPADRPGAVLQSLGAAPDSGEGPDRFETLEFAATDQYAAMVDCFGRSIAARRLEDPAEDGLAQMVVLDRLLAAARR